MSKIKNTIKGTIDAFRHFAADRSGVVNVDSSWTNRSIYYYLEMYRHREEYLWQLEQGGIYEDKVIDQEYDVLPCIALERVDQASECPCAPASGCMFLRSKYPIPEMAIRDNHIVVTDILGNNQFNYVKWFNFSRKINGRKSAQSGYTYFTFKHIDDETYLYIHNEEFLERAAMTAKFTNPVDVKKFPKCDEFVNVVDCSILEQPFDMRREIQPIIFEKTFRAMVSMRSQTPIEDEYNDNSDDTASQPKIK